MAAKQSAALSNAARHVIGRVVTRHHERNKWRVNCAHRHSLQTLAIRPIVYRRRKGSFDYHTKREQHCYEDVSGEQNPKLIGNRRKNGGKVSLRSEKRIILSVCDEIGARRP